MGVVGYLIGGCGLPMTFGNDKCWSSICSSSSLQEWPCLRSISHLAPLENWVETKIKFVHVHTCTCLFIITV